LGHFFKKTHLVTLRDGDDARVCTKTSVHKWTRGGAKSCSNDSCPTDAKCGGPQLSALVSAGQMHLSAFRTGKCGIWERAGSLSLCFETVRLEGPAAKMFTV
jgi:hypothetical protein